MNYYKFIVWASLYVQALMCAYYAVKMFQGASLLGLVGPATGPASGFLSGFSFMTIVLALGFVLVGLYCIYARGRLAQFKRDAPTVYLMRIPIIVVIVIVSVLPSLFQAFVSYGEYLGEIAGYLITATLPTLLLYGGLIALQWYLEKLYLDKRSELFVN